MFIRKKFALPEDVEYFNIQLQMNYDLFDEYKEVERIIGMYVLHMCTCRSWGYGNAESKPHFARSPPPPVSQCDLQALTHKLFRRRLNHFSLGFCVLPAQFLSIYASLPSLSDTELE